MNFLADSDAVGSEEGKDARFLFERVGKLYGDFRTDGHTSRSLNIGRYGGSSKR